MYRVTRKGRFAVDREGSSRMMRIKPVPPSKSVAAAETPPVSASASAATMRRWT
jgi:hypothetical protein